MAEFIELPAGCTYGDGTNTVAKCPLQRLHNRLLFISNNDIMCSLLRR